MLCVLALALTLLVPDLHADNPVRGPVAVELVRVIDGDTIVVSGRLWPAIRLDDAVIRIIGVDTPELRSRCASEAARARERQRARAARHALETLLRAADGQISVFDVVPGRYGGRYAARVRVNGQDVADWLIAQGHGRAHAGRGATRSWCEEDVHEDRAKSDAEPG